MRTINNNRIKILVLLSSTLFLLFMNIEGSFASGIIKIYWANVNEDESGNSKIQRADLDDETGEVTEIVTLVDGLVYPLGIAIDENDGKLYWVDWEWEEDSGETVGKIYRADLDGSTQKELVITGLEFPIGIALDTENGKMYWTSQSSPAIIQRADLAGVEHLFHCPVLDLDSEFADKSGAIAGFLEKIRHE